MRTFRKFLEVAVAMLASVTGSCPGSRQLSAPPTIAGHAVRLDEHHRLLSWWPGDAPYAHVAHLAWHAMETRFPPQDNGLETWLTNSRFDPDTGAGINWPHNPAGLYAMLTDSALLWYEFSGDVAAMQVARKALDHQIEQGTTPVDWDWGRVPYASSTAGDVEYAGADETWCDGCGRGDGVGVIEPDKVGELGFAYLQMFEWSGDPRYRDAAEACADALVKHVRHGDARSSPWPFRVRAQTGVVREQYSSNVVGALTLFDELGRLSIGDVAGYRRARALALDWLLRVPVRNDAWSGYFEDMDIQTDPGRNTNQYAPMRTARWLIDHPEADASWREDVARLTAWVAREFGADTTKEAGVQWGATVIGEQLFDVVKMGSHTARYGATNALWAEATADARARERAFRSLNWATYMCAADGIVAVGEDANEGWWFSDGYGDYIRHFMVAMAAVPEWAPVHANHILRSTSVVTSVDYAYPARVAWTTFDSDATETLRLASHPVAIVDGAGILMERDDLNAAGYVVRVLPSGDTVVRVHHRGPGSVIATLRR
jgi:uncharacterized protein YbjQ (UPF0145 family)